MTHTPGPWFATNVEYPDPRDGPMRQAEEGTWTVSPDPLSAGWCHDGGYAGYGVSEANARLMASAPELLEVLKNALPLLERVLDQFEAWPLADLTDAINAAIAKAEGK